MFFVVVRVVVVVRVPLARGALVRTLVEPNSYLWDVAQWWWGGNGSAGGGARGGGGSRGEGGELFTGFFTSPVCCFFFFFLFFLSILRLYSPPDVLDLYGLPEAKMCFLLMAKSR